MADEESEEVVPELDKTTGDPEDDAANSEWTTNPDTPDEHDSREDNPPIQQQEEAGMGS